MPKKTQHGGARPGSGRKPITGEPLVQRTLQLPQFVIDAANEHPDGPGPAMRDALIRWAKRRRSNPKT